MKLVKSQYNSCYDLELKTLLMEVNESVNEIIRIFKFITNKGNSPRGINLKFEMFKKKIKYGFEFSIMKSEKINLLLKENAEFDKYAIYNFTLYILKRLDFKKDIKNAGFYMFYRGEWDEEALNYRPNKIDLQHLIKLYRNQANKKELEFASFSEKQRIKLFKNCYAIFNLIAL